MGNQIATDLRNLDPRSEKELAQSQDTDLIWGKRRFLHAATLRHQLEQQNHIPPSLLDGRKEVEQKEVAAAFAPESPETLRNLTKVLRDDVKFCLESCQNRGSRDQGIMRTAIIQTHLSILKRRYGIGKQTSNIRIQDFFPSLFYIPTDRFSGLATLFDLIHQAPNNSKLYSVFVTKVLQVYSLHPPMTLSRTQVPLTGDINSFLNSALKRQIPKTEKRPQEMTLVARMYVALAKGDLATVLDTVYRLVSKGLEGEEECVSNLLSQVLGNIAQLPTLYRLRRTAFTWSNRKKGKEVTISTEGKTASWKGGTKWSFIVSNEEINEGVNYVEFSVDHSESDNLLLGLVGPEFYEFGLKPSFKHMYVLQADGVAIMNNENVGQVLPFSEGEKVGILIDMSDKSLIFIINGTRQLRPPFRPLPSRLFLIACFRSATQVVSISEESAVPTVVQELTSVILPRKPEFPVEFLSSSASSKDILVSLLSELSRNALIYFQDSLFRTPKLPRMVTQPSLFLDIRRNTFKALFKMCRLAYMRCTEKSEECQFWYWMMIYGLRLLRVHVAALSVWPEVRAAEEPGTLINIRSILQSALEKDWEFKSLDESLFKTELALVFVNGYDFLYPSPTDKFDFLSWSFELHSRKPRHKFEFSFSLVGAVTSDQFIEKIFEAEKGLKVMNKVMKLFIGICTDSELSESDRRSNESMNALAFAQKMLISKAEEQHFEGGWGETLTEYTCNLLEAGCNLLRKMLNTSDLQTVRIQGKGTILERVVPTLFFALSICDLRLWINDRVLVQVAALLQLISILFPLQKSSNPCKSEVVETDHPYRSPLHMSRLYSLPDSSEITLVFDPRSRTAGSVLEVWLNKEKTKKLGQWQDSEFPIDAVLVESQELLFVFISEQHSAWGWKVTIVPKISNWVKFIRKSLYSFLTEVCKTLISRSFDTSEPKIMESPLLQFGIADKCQYCITGLKPSLDSDLIHLSSISFRVFPDQETKPNFHRGASQHIEKDQSAALHLSNYIGNFPVHSTSFAHYSENSVLEQFITGGRNVDSAWIFIKQESGCAVGNIGGTDLDQAERAVFAVFLSLFGLEDRLSELLEADSVDDMVKSMVKQTCQVRRWAQLKKQQGNSLSYADLQQEVLAKCTVLLHIDFPAVRIALGLSKFIASSPSLQAATSPVELTRQKSADMSKDLGSSLSVARIRELLQVAVPNVSEREELVKREVKLAADTVYEFLQSEIPAFDLIQICAQRRIRAMERCVGLDILVQIMKSADRSNHMAYLSASALSSSFQSVSGPKTYYLQGVSGVDPALLQCINHSYFSLFQCFASCLDLSVVRNLDCTSEKVAQTYLSLMEALACPFQHRDMEALSKVRLKKTLEFLITWAKGEEITEMVRKKLDWSQCVTNIEIQGKKLKVIYGGPAPITKIAIGPEAKLGFGPPRGRVCKSYYLFFTSESPESNKRYLTRLSVLSKSPFRIETQFTPHSNLLIPDESPASLQSRSDRKQLLRRSAWSLLKIMLYECCAQTRSQFDSAEAMLQTTFLSVLTPDLTWFQPKNFLSGTRVAIEKLRVKKVSSGVLWLSLEEKRGHQVDLNQKNPIEEWVRQFSEVADTLAHSEYSSSAIQEFARNFHQEIVRFVTSSNSLKSSTTSSKETEELEQYRNTEGEVDFFVFAHAELNKQLTKAGLSVPNLPVYTRIPSSLAQARSQLGFGTVFGLVSQLMTSIQISREGRLSQLLSWFKDAWRIGKPGLISENVIPGPVPQAFRNENKELDLLVLVNAIKDRQAEFPAEWQALKSVLPDLDTYPRSCSELYGNKGLSPNFTASLLWVLHQCMRSTGFQLALAHSPLLTELLKHVFASGSQISNVVATRVLNRLVSTVLSPAAIQKHWDGVSKQFLHEIAIPDSALGDPVRVLLALEGLEAGYHFAPNKGRVMSYRVIKFVSAEAMDCLRSMCQAAVWRTRVLDVLSRVLGTFLSKPYEELVAEFDLELGALSFLSGQMDSSGVREWTLMEVNGSREQVVSIREKDSSVQLCSTEDGVFIREPIRNAQKTASTALDQLLTDISPELAEELFQLLTKTVATAQSAQSVVVADIERTHDIRAVWRQAGTLAMKGMLQMISNRLVIGHDVLLSASETVLAFPKPKENSTVESWEQLRNAFYSHYKHRVEQQRGFPGFPSFSEDNKESISDVRERELRTLDNLSDKDQTLFGLLLALGCSFPDIQTEYESGLRDAEAILESIQTKHKSIVSFCNKGGNIQIRENSGITECKQLQTGHLIINANTPCDERKAITINMNKDFACHSREFCSEISVFLALGFRHDGEIYPGQFGVSLGTFNIDIWSERGIYSILHQNKVVFSSVFTPPLHLELRVLVTSTGEIQLQHQNQEFQIPQLFPDVFDGLNISPIGIFMCGNTAGRLVLKGVAICPGRVQAISQFWTEPEDAIIELRGQFPGLRKARTNFTSLRLELMGVPEDVARTYAAKYPQFKEAATEVLGNEDAETWTTTLRRDLDLPISDILIVDSIDKLPVGFEPVSGTESYPHTRVLAFQRTPRPDKRYITGLFYGMTGGDYIGYMALDDSQTNSVPIVIVREAKETCDFITDLRFVTAKGEQYELPEGFQVLEYFGKAVNFAEKNSDKGVVLAFKKGHLFLNCPIVSFARLSDKSNQYGLVDSFEEEKHSSMNSQFQEQVNYSKCSILELHSHLLLFDQSNLLSLSQDFLLSVLQQHPELFQKLVSKDETRLIPVLNRVSQRLDTVKTPFITLLCNETDRAARTLLVECLNSFSTEKVNAHTETLEVESLHPYTDNMRFSQKITIPSAKKLLVKFDSRSATEQNCDFLRFYSDPTHTRLVFEHSGKNFPNVEVEGDSLYLFFYSDASRVDWGYRFLVEGFGFEAESIKLESRPLRLETAMWVIDQVIAAGAKNPAIVSHFTRKEFLYSLAAFIYTSSETKLRTKAVEAITELLILAAPSRHRICSEILRSLAIDAHALYSSDKDTKISSNVTRCMLTALLSVSGKYTLGLSGRWLKDVTDAWELMNGFLRRDERMYHLLLQPFIATNHVRVGKTYESVHPALTQSTVTEIFIPGASSLDICIDPASAFPPDQDLYFSYDFEGLRHIVQREHSEALQDAHLRMDPNSPRVDLTNAGMSISGVAGSWGLLSEHYSSGQYRITLYIDNDGNSTELFIGLLPHKDLGYDLEDFIVLNPNAWIWKGNGSFRDQGKDSLVDEAVYRSGDIISFLLDMQALTVTCCKNGNDCYQFDSIAEDLILGVCFGGEHQMVSLVSVESMVPIGSQFGKGVIARGDKAYCHFPVNAGFLTLRGNEWERFPSDLQESIIFSEGCTRLRRIEDSDQFTTVHLDTVIQHGKHYYEIQVIDLSQGILQIGLANRLQDARQEAIISYSSNGTISQNGEERPCRPFLTKDIVGALVSVERGLVKFYLNGEHVASIDTMIEGEDYAFAVCLKSIGQEVVLNTDPKPPVGEDLYHPDNPSTRDYWGYRLKVTPKFSEHDSISQLSLFSQEEMTQWLSFLTHFRTSVESCYEVIVQFIDSRSAATGMSPLYASNLDLKLGPADLEQYSALAHLSPEDMKLAFHCLSVLNNQVRNVIHVLIPEDKPFDELREIQKTFLNCKNLIFLCVKEKMFKELLAKTTSSDWTSVVVDRTKAMKWKRDGKVDSKLTVSVFSQLCKLTNSNPHTTLRNPDRIYRMTFAGEGATDAGGPYNETMSTICDELHSQLIPMLIPTQNNQHSLGEGRDAWLPNPGSNSPSHLSHFLYLGKLLGVAIRTQNSLNLSLPALFWKRVLNDSVSSSDLKSVDEATYHMLSILRNPESNRLTEETFSDAFAGVSFTYGDSSGKIVELVSGGKEMQVTYGNAKEFANAVELLRLTESADIYTAIRKGMSAVVPIQLLRVFSWKQVENLVCGAPDLDVDLLRRKTNISVREENLPIVQWLWSVLKEFTPQQRSMFLRFVWGRSRLPISSEFRNFTINDMYIRYQNRPPDDYLPVAHTCGFSLDLPAYSSPEVLKRKLLYAITQCQGIDLDYIVGGGWADDEE